MSMEEDEAMRMKSRQHMEHACKETRTHARTLGPCSDRQEEGVAAGSSTVTLPAVGSYLEVKLDQWQQENGLGHGWVAAGGQREGSLGLERDSTASVGAGQGGALTRAEPGPDSAHRGCPQVTSTAPRCTSCHDLDFEQRPLGQTGGEQQSGRWLDEGHLPLWLVG